MTARGGDTLRIIRHFQGECSVSRIAPEAVHPVAAGPASEASLRVPRENSPTYGRGHAKTSGSCAGLRATGAARCRKAVTARPQTSTEHVNEFESPDGIVRV
jgi:hypothetical protein